MVGPEWFFVTLHSAKLHRNSMRWSNNRQWSSFKRRGSGLMHVRWDIRKSNLFSISYVMSKKKSKNRRLPSSSYWTLTFSRLHSSYQTCIKICNSRQTSLISRYETQNNHHVCLRGRAWGYRQRAVKLHLSSYSGLLPRKQTAQRPLQVPKREDKS